MHVVRDVQPEQLVPCPPPGFSQAAPDVACSVRSSQAHWPAEENVWFACTEIQ